VPSQIVEPTVLENPVQIHGRVSAKCYDSLPLPASPLLQRQLIKQLQVDALPLRADLTARHRGADAAVWLVAVAAVVKAAVASRSGEVGHQVGQLLGRDLAQAKFLEAR
jgi:hypothetical protein